MLLVIRTVRSLSAASGETMMIQSLSFDGTYILMPARVFLLSGSSETRVSAEEFGFLKETCDRYGEHGPVLHSKCIDCFKTLPLASDFADNVSTQIMAASFKAPLGSMKIALYCWVH